MEFPDWLAKLMLLMATGYRELWTKSLSTQEVRNANNYVWYTALKDVPEQFIEPAFHACLKQYTYPPSIQQFLDIANTLQKNIRMDNATGEVAAILNAPRPPPSPLLAEYMAKHGIDEHNPQTQREAKILCMKTIRDLPATLVLKNGDRRS